VAPAVNEPTITVFKSTNQPDTLIDHHGTLSVTLPSYQITLIESFQESYEELKLYLKTNMKEEAKLSTVQHLEEPLKNCK
jgi:hypothetical protein